VWETDTRIWIPFYFNLLLLGNFTNLFSFIFQEMLEIFAENRKLHQNNSRLLKRLAFYETSNQLANTVAAGYLEQVRVKFSKPNYPKP
jgi:hypothetical protein